jgi:hypothetical protein
VSYITKVVVTTHFLSFCKPLELEVSTVQFTLNMDITEKAEVGLSTAGKGEGELIHADEVQLAEMGTSCKQVSRKYSPDDL